MTSPDKPESKANQRGELLEWAIAGVAALAVLTLFGFLLFEALTTPETPPAFAMQVTDLRQEGGMHYVTIAVHNKGASAAADARVTGSIDVGGEAETATAMLDYAPANSKAEVVLIFSTPVDVNALRLRVESFRSP
jgi:uncharacterized protein (TIGR02588 family)